MSAVERSPRRGRRRMIVGYEKGVLPVKSEPDEDIKDYAETTMNELLGWYGYEKVDSRDTQGLNLTHFASTNSSTNANSASPSSSPMEGSDASEDVISHSEDRAPSIRPDSAHQGPEASSLVADEVARQHQQMVSALPSINKHPDAPDSPNLPPGCIVCAWCQKIGMKLFTLKTPSGCKAFCSELCFTQCRRASFKKNKICDWCKHVRHTVNYVDFQDGEQQLQFCSDKCLNQYKMNIFCNETQAHLQMHTHLKETACKLTGPPSVTSSNNGSNMNLITPELWLRDCNKQHPNGNSASPTNDDVIIDDVMSDDNVPVAVSPPVTVVPRPKSRSPLARERKEPKSRSSKDREKIQRKSASKSSLKKGDSEKKTHSSKHKEKKIFDAVHADVSNLSEPPLLISPPSLNPGGLTNGTTPHLSSPPIGSLTRPPYVPQLQSRHGLPVPSPLSLQHPEKLQYFSEKLVAPNFHIMAAQHMRDFLRSHPGLDRRSNLPPLPIPSWLMAPFSQIPHPPPPPPPPPTLTSESPSLPHSISPEKPHNHHHHHHSKINHQEKHKHKNSAASHHSKTSSHKVTHHRENNAAVHPPAPPPVPASLLPPVTVMVPFPLVIPVPVPIPIPIPVKQEVFEKFESLRQKTPPNANSSKNSIVLKLKRKKPHDSSKQSSLKKRKNCMSHYSVEPAKAEAVDELVLVEKKLADKMPSNDYFKNGKLDTIYERMYGEGVTDEYLGDYNSLPDYLQAKKTNSIHDERQVAHHNCFLENNTHPDILGMNDVDGISPGVDERTKARNRPLLQPLALVRRLDRTDNRTVTSKENLDLFLRKSPLPINAHSPQLKAPNDCEELLSSDNRSSPCDSVENLTLRVSNSVNVIYNHSENSRSEPKDCLNRDVDQDSSRSFSPLSETAASSGEEKKSTESNNNGDIGGYPRITFSSYNLNSRSSPIHFGVGTNPDRIDATSIYSKQH